MSPMLQIALSQYGVKERLGSYSNPRIEKYFRETGFSYADDSINWCGIFMLWCLKRSGGVVPPGTNHTSLQVARNWLKLGTEVSSPQLGDVVVYWRGSVDSWKGHVGLYINHSQDKRHIYTLGGNQSNRVSIAGHSSGKLLGYRRINL